MARICHFIFGESSQQAYASVASTTEGQSETNGVDIISPPANFGLVHIACPLCVHLLRPLALLCRAPNPATSADSVAPLSGKQWCR